MLGSSGEAPPRSQREKPDPAQSLRLGGAATSQRPPQVEKSPARIQGLADARVGQRVWVGSLKLGCRRGWREAKDTRWQMGFLRFRHERIRNGYLAGSSEKWTQGCGFVEFRVRWWREESTIGRMDEWMEAGSSRRRLDGGIRKPGCLGRSSWGRCGCVRWTRPSLKAERDTCMSEPRGLPRGMSQCDADVHISVQTHGCEPSRPGCWRNVGSVRR